MIPRGVAKRYATALFNSALGAGIMPDVREETRAFKTLLSDTPGLRDFLLSPQVMADEKKAIIDTALGGRASDLFVRFLRLLVDKKRLPFVEEIADAYNYLYERHEGILEVRVITAVPLDDAMREKTLAKLGKETGKTIRITPVVDPDVIGGVILVMEDKIIDGSIRHYLETLRRDLDTIRV